MHIKILNMSLLAAWLLITAGGIIVNVGYGLMVSGFVLLVLAAVLAWRIGVYSTTPGETD
jgi:multisubunit Na+/H+ antiporter MnhE subunit